MTSAETVSTIHQADSLADISPLSWQHRLLYISTALLALLIALGALGGSLALILTLPVSWPILLAMAPLGAIFLAASFAFFKTLGQFPTIKKALHHLMTGLNVAVNSSYATSSIVNLVLLGLGLTLTAPVLIIIAPIAISAIIGFGLGILERKQKYTENAKLKEVADKKKQQLDKLQQQVAAKQAALIQDLSRNEQQAMIQKRLAEWEARKDEIQAKVLYQPSQKSKTKEWFDYILEKINDIKNYLRNIRTLGKFLPLILITLGVAVSVATLNPVFVVLAVAAGGVLATMNHYSGQWEDETFTKNNEYNKQINQHNLALALAKEKKLLLQQLQQIKNGEPVSLGLPAGKKTAPDFNKKFANPMDKVNYSAGVMYAISLLTSTETLLYAGLSLVGLCVGLKLTLLTGGLAAPIGLAICVTFAALAVVSVVRRANKEYKQQQKQAELVDKYNTLLAKLNATPNIALASKLVVDVHNYRSSLGGFNYAAYKSISGLKKVGKGFTTITEILQATHVPLTTLGITIGSTVLNPALLGIGLIIGIPLAVASFKAERVRTARDIALTELEMITGSMEIAVKQIEAAEQRVKIVEQVQKAAKLTANKSDKPAPSKYFAAKPVVCASDACKNKEAEESYQPPVTINNHKFFKPAPCTKIITHNIAKQPSEQQPTDKIALSLKTAVFFKPDMRPAKNCPLTASVTENLARKMIIQNSMSNRAAVAA